jgi:hypothetical protein
MVLMLWNSPRTFGLDIFSLRNLLLFEQHLRNLLNLNRISCFELYKFVISSVLAAWRNFGGITQIKLICSGRNGVEIRVRSLMLTEEIDLFLVLLRHRRRNIVMLWAGRSRARTVQGGAPVLFWVPERHSGTFVKDSDVRYRRRSLRAKWLWTLCLKCTVLHCTVLYCLL